MLNTILGSFSSGVAASTSSYESIATVTASGGESSLSLTSIPSTYKHLQIRCIAKCSSNGSGYMIFNSVTSAAYSNHYIYGDGSSVAASGGSSQSNMFAYYASGTANIYGAGIIDIIDYASTSKYKTFKSLTGGDINTTPSYIEMFSGCWQDTAAITSITFTPQSGTFSAASTFALYGIKG